MIYPGLDLVTLLSISIAEAQFLNPPGDWSEFENEEEEHDDEDAE